MNDLATHWISPAWINDPGEPGPGGVPPASEVDPPVLAVANPGSEPANVKANYYNHDGSVHLSVGTIVPPHGSVFLHIYDISETGGWLGIASDRPVAPWGTTQVAGWPEQRVNMTFFRVDPPVLEFDPNLIKEL